jgi:short-subunit dehydrogenase
MKDKVVIITGASSGIGKALAYHLGGKGAKVVVAARNVVTLNEVVAELQSKGGDVLAIPTDVSVEKDCRQLIERTIEKYGKIDILINNAGISMRALFGKLDLQVMHRVMDTNFWGTVNCTKFALPHLLKSKGSLVGVISIGGHVGMPGRSAYSASKFAIRGFLDSIRIENRKTGLHVLVAAPGFTTSNIRRVALMADGSEQGESPRNESGMMPAEEVAVRIVKAIEKRRRKLILTFFEGKLTVFLGKFCPRLLDSLIYYSFAREPKSPFK